MIRKVAEEHHHTVDEVREYVNSALVIADGGKVPAALREAVFVETVRLLATKQIWHEQVAPMVATPTLNQRG